MQLAAPLEVLGKAAAELKFRKRTRIGQSSSRIVFSFLALLALGSE